MWRVDHVTKATDLFGTGRHGYTDGSVATQTPATKLVSAAMNPIQEEIARAVEEHGYALSSSNNAQLIEAIEAISALSRSHLACHNAAARTPGSAYASQFRGVAKNSSKWLAVGASSGIQVSTDDGATWSAKTSPGAYWLCCASSDAGNGVAAGDSGGSAVIVSTSDFNTFTSRTPAGTYAGLSFLGAAFGFARFFLVGTGGRIQKSTDGTGAAWSDLTPASGYTGTFGCITYANALLVAGCDNGTVQTSSDGTSWASRTLVGATSPNLSTSGLAYGNGRWVGVGMGSPGGTGAAISVDGVTWDVVDTNLTFLPKAVTFSSGVFIAVGSSGKFAVSILGKRWLELTLPGLSADLYAIANNGHSVIAAGDSGTLRQSLNF